MLVFERYFSTVKLTTKISVILEAIRNKFTQKLNEILVKGKGFLSHLYLMSVSRKVFNTKQSRNLYSRMKSIWQIGTQKKFFVLYCEMHNLKYFFLMIAFVNK